MRKIIYIDKKAVREIKKFPHEVVLKLTALFEILESDGKLYEPFGKKLTGENNLFEIRVKHLGQWRVIYAYFEENKIVILSGFTKKTQKTAKKEIDTARQRLKEYL